MSAIIIHDVLKQDVHGRTGLLAYRAFAGHARKLLDNYLFLAVDPSQPLGSFLFATNLARVTSVFFPWCTL